MPIWESIAFPGPAPPTRVVCVRGWCELSSGLWVMHGLPPCVLSEYFSCVLVVYVMRKASGGVCVWGGGVVQLLLNVQWDDTV